MGSCVSTSHGDNGRATDRVQGFLPDEVNRLLDKWAIGHVMRFMECKSSKSSELDLLGFRNFFTELDQGVPKSVVSAAFVQFDTRRVGRLSFRDICFGLATACISSWELRSRFLFEMFGSDGALTRAELVELLRAVIAAVRRSNELEDDSSVRFDEDIVPGFDTFHLGGLSPPSLERIQSCFTAAQSEACEGFTSLPPEPVASSGVELSLTPGEEQWMDEQIAHLVLSDQLISFSEFLPWSCRNSHYLFRFFLLFEVVPSPDRERKTCLRILAAAGPEPIPGSTWFVVSYKWMQLWKSYVRWLEPDSLNTVWDIGESRFDSNRFVGSPVSRPVSFTSVAPLNILHAVSTMDAMSCTSTVIQQRMAERPLAVNNADLEGELKGALKPNLIEHHDFLLVPEEMWNHLLEWYGGGPAFPRKAAAVRRRRLSSSVSNTFLHSSYSLPSLTIELYPPLILVVLCGPNGLPVRHLTKRFFVSRADSCDDLTAQLARKMAGTGNSCRLWHRKDGEGWELIAREDPRRIDDFGEVSTGTFMLEIQGLEGTWPMNGTNSQDREGQVGDRVDAKGGDSLWHPATIVDLTENSVKVHFDGEKYQLDAWLNCTDSEEIAPLGTHTETPPIDKGVAAKRLTGLANIGNTCFMNATLQCLSATPMLREYFVSGRGEFEKHVHANAKVAVEFAKLLVELNAGRSTAVVPTAFKKALDKYAPLFSGYDHQDAHELLALLLDGLHEDLNRAAKLVKEETKTDSSLVAWQQHRSEHTSVISDLFDGQQQISTQCRECGFRSTLFEPFRYIMLPVPVTDHRKFVVHLFLAPTSSNLRPKLVRLVVTVSKSGLMQSVLDALAAEYEAWTPAITLAEVYMNRIHRLIDITTPVSEFRSEDRIFAFQTESDSHEEFPETVFAQILHRRELVTKRQRRTMTRREVFGLPVILAINPKWTHQQLLAAVKLHLARFVSVVAPKNCFTLRMVSPDGASCSGCGKCDAGCVIGGTHRATKFKGPWLYLAVDWASPSYYDASMETVMLTPKSVRKEQVLAKLGGPVRLYDCVDEYTAAEELVGENQWECEQCKHKCDAERKITYTVTPDVLVILLKRFQFTSAGCEKINVPIQFPLTDLVLRTSSLEKYDLFGVVNHFGSLGAGHYTALCKHTESWSLYNDHQVQSVQPRDVENCARNCYVLFYKRNGVRPANIINYGNL